MDSLVGNGTFVARILPEYLLTSPQRKDLVEALSAEPDTMKAGLLDEINLHLVPVLLGEGIRLFENIGTEQIKLEKISVTEAPNVTHFRFRVVR